MQPQTPQAMKTQSLFPSMPNTITTDEIQKYLDENKMLILAILENQNLGKLTECAQYQAQLQKNLMYLAAIADAQPQAPTMSSQTSLQSVVQQEHHIQQPPQPATTAQQQQTSVLTPKLPFHLSNALQSQDQHQFLLQQQLIQQGQMGMRHHQAMQMGPATSGSLADPRKTGSGGNRGGHSASGRGSRD